jgi:hypothetical protein
MVEMRLAVEEVYQIVEVYDVYEYDVTHYDPATDTGTDTFLKLKSEASRYAELIQCPDKEERCIRDFNVTQAIRLDKDAIERTMPSDA